MSDGDQFLFFLPRGVLSTSLMAGLYFRRVGPLYYIDVIRYSEGGVYLGLSFTPVELAAYKLRLETIRSSAAGVADARVRLFVNDIEKTNDTGYINYTSAGLVLKCWSGCCAEKDNGTSGSFRIGNISITDGFGGMFASASDFNKIESIQICALGRRMAQGGAKVEPVGKGKYILYLTPDFSGKSIVNPGDVVYYKNMSLIISEIKQPGIMKKILYAQRG